jgi:hypothetical protein
MLKSTTRAVALSLLFCLIASAQVCVLVPTAGASITQSTLDELKKRGALAPGVSAFASLEAFAMAFGGSLPYIPANAADNKFWADFTAGSDYVTVDGSLDTADAATWSDFSMTVYGSTIARFFQDRAKAKDPVFRRIPRFKRFTSSEPAQMNMLLGVGKPGPRNVTVGEAPYPLARLMNDPVADGGKRWSWAANHILRFNPESGDVETCDYQAYGQAFPIVTTVSVGNASGAIRVRGMGDEAFLSAVGAALFGGGTPAERVAKILSNLEVK